ncbi:MAG: error-prone DNA polymerase, partial [Paracoccaceae bacterium]
MNILCRMVFAELNITSNFTFLRGGAHPEEYADLAALMGMPALAIADENSVAGIVRAHMRLREVARQVNERRQADAMGPPAPENHAATAGNSAHILNVPRLIPAARLVLDDGFSLAVLPRDRVAWGRLCRLLSKGRLRAEKGKCLLRFADLLE